MANKQPKASQYIDQLRLLGYEFRMNHARIIEVNGVPITDGLAAEIRMAMRDAGFPYVKVMEDAYTAHAYANQYHPVQDYLTGLTYLGQPTIRALANYFTDKNDAFYPFLRRWMIGACAKAMEGGQNFMLVLDGPQDIGKSYFAKWLCPLPEFFIEGGINTTEKDVWLRLSHYWIWEVDELDATTRKADRSALKSFITRRNVTERRSYGRHDETLPALASLIGTINTGGNGFLNDPTGNRRFAVVELENIDRAYSREIDKHQLWAEAYALYDSGEDWRLTPEEKALQREINEEYEYSSPTEEFFWRYYDIDPTLDEWMPVADIIAELEIRGLKTPQHRAMMDLADLLKRAGVEKARKGRDRVTSYKGIREKVRMGGLVP